MSNWLDDFCQIIDYDRMKRGKRLYESNHVQHFTMNSDRTGFSAAVRGSGDRIYHVQATFPQIDGEMPDIEQLRVQCDCPDWVEFCKHSICAIHFFSEYGHAPVSSPNKNFPEVEQAKHRIQWAMRQPMVSLPELGAPPFLNERKSFDEMHRVLLRHLRTSRSDH
ncbi:MAG TPA: hypothetical protein VFK44_02615 [Bacillales bacterium]|nr:hypothetical protein [Bacillales bacterium]